MDRPCTQGTDAALCGVCTLWRPMSTQAKTVPCSSSVTFTPLMVSTCAHVRLRVHTVAARGTYGCSLGRYCAPGRRAARGPRQRSCRPRRSRAPWPRQQRAPPVRTKPARPISVAAAVATSEEARCPQARRRELARPDLPKPPWCAAGEPPSPPPRPPAATHRRPRERRAAPTRACSAAAAAAAPLGCVCAARLAPRGSPQPSSRARAEPAAARHHLRISHGARAHRKTQR